MEEEKRAVCAKGHSFDRGKEGYWNLLLNSASHNHGDDKAMLRSRRLFLDGGHYAPLLSLLCQKGEEYFSRGSVLVDAGCGEGYYTNGIFSFLSQRGKEPLAYAFDISKEAVKMTAKRCGGQGCFFVASSFHIPMADASVDGVFSLFSPYTESEFLRILKPEGLLIRAYPEREHLFSLKAAVYEDPCYNEKAAEIGEGFSVVEQCVVRKNLHLGSPEEIRALFDMTPYARKTSPQDREKLESLGELHTQMEIGVQILKKVLK
jgi:23S rRNA (guanine745-N1)-methyltransferase